MMTGNGMGLFGAAILAPNIRVRVRFWVRIRVGLRLGLELGLGSGLELEFGTNDSLRTANIRCQNGRAKKYHTLQDDVGECF